MSIHSQSTVYSQYSCRSLTPPHARPTTEALAELEPITVDMIRNAAKRFSHATASTYDGFHPGHSALLGDAELELVSRFMHSFKDVGLMPSQVRATVTLLIPKHKQQEGQAEKPSYRGIGLMSSIWRPWAMTPPCAIES